MPDTPTPPPSGRPDDEPDFEAMLRSLLGDTDNPDVAKALGAMGLDQSDPATMGMISAQLKAMFSGEGGAFNVEMAHDVARKTVSAAGDSSVSAAMVRDVTQVAQVASLWLDEVTDLGAPSAGVHAWSRAEWVEQTMPVWQQLVQPVAEGVSSAIQSAMKEQLGGLGGEGLPGMPPGLPPGMDPSALMGQMEPMIARMSGSMFGMQVGQAVGTLAADLVTGTEVGLPLVPDHAVVVLPANVQAFAEGLSVDAGEVHLYLVVREAARVRLFAGVPWLGPQLIAAVQAYARDIRIDTEGISSAITSVDPSDPAAMQEALAGSLFTPEPSAAQQSALRRLETYLALVEGWVDVVTERATSRHLPHVAALGEAVRRRRASGGPAERVFSQLVGLELRPRRMRDAANLWAALESSAGPQGRLQDGGHVLGEVGLG
ncbi:zinc-dependent metalloprotease, partial [Segeticoccus rhizosphaerae]|uniref:zinc-dependent metalloprotease n=1 Tax=Segeticoccus rhizosphaerae TaxID=1104777 RepID=UPI001EF0A6CF